MKKICSKCGIEKDLEEFYKRKDSKDGKRSECKLCCINKQNLHRLANIDSIKKYKAAYYKSNKAKIKKYKFENKEKIKDYNSKYYLINKDYFERYYLDNKDRFVKYYENNKQRKQEYDKIYRELHKNDEEFKIKRRNIQYKRRALEKESGHFTAAEWREVLQEYGAACLHCGSTEHLTVDHVIPLSKGGPNTKNNLQPLCMKHNCSKGIKTIDYRRINNEI